MLHNLNRNFFCKATFYSKIEKSEVKTKNPFSFEHDGGRDFDFREDWTKESDRNHILRVQGNLWKLFKSFVQTALISKPRTLDLALHFVARKLNTLGWATPPPPYLENQGTTLHSKHFMSNFKMVFNLFCRKYFVQYKLTMRSHGCF